MGGLYHVAVMDAAHGRLVFDRGIPSNSSYPAQGLEQYFRLVGRHARDTQAAYLRSLSQTLESDGDFPAFCLVEDEDVFLAFAVSYTGAQDVVGA